jgi:hypothetical protein
MRFNNLQFPDDIAQFRCPIFIAVCNNNDVRPEKKKVEKDEPLPESRLRD